MVPAAVAPQFVAGGIFTLPVLSVILVAFAGGLSHRARQVVQTAIPVLAVALGPGELTVRRRGRWPIVAQGDGDLVDAGVGRGPGEGT